MLWNIVVLMNIYIPDWWRKSFFHALFLQIFLYGKRVCYGLIHKEMHLGVGLKSRWLMLLCQEGQGKGCIDKLWQLRVPQMEMKCQ
ncbi:hypothetical protein WL886_22730 [Escherichia coli]|nr:hypothetical protein MWN26_14085 [Escherichia coli]